MDCITIATWVYAGATIALFIAAGVAAYIARKHLKVVSEQLELNIYLSLLNELSKERARENRELIHQQLTNAEENIKDSIINNQSRLKGAVEETISLMDRIGFFLLKGGPSLRQGAPDFIWEITADMWKRVEWFVKYRRKTSKTYAIYFEKLAQDKKAKAYIDQVQKESENQRNQEEPPNATG